MITFYRCLLYLYPSLYRHEFAEEMVSVFRDAHADVTAASFRERTGFRVRETCGLLAGAVQEHFHAAGTGFPSISFTRFDMRPEFRFPRSTVVLMSIIFAGVIVAMEKANTIQVKYGEGYRSIWASLPWFFVLMLLFTLVTSAAVLGIRFALGRSGAHRLANLQPGANRPD